MKKCHELMRELREDRDLKQKEIAAMLGTTQQQYSKYENNSTELPARVLSSLADYYQVSADYLLGRSPFQTSVSEFEMKLSRNPVMAEVMADLQALDSEQLESIAKIVKGLTKS